MKKYIVYKIVFKEQMAVYIGCTSNLKQRTNQHKSCTSKTRLYNFVRKHGLSNEISLLSISSFDNKKDALNFEKRYINRVSINTAYNVLNETWTQGCKFPNSGKSGELSHSSKEWVVINLSDKSVTNVLSLKKFGENNDLNYKDLHACALGRINTSQGYKCFRKTEWIQLSDNKKTHYINGDFLKELKAIKANSISKRCSKQYVVVTPNQEILKVVGLDKYAEQSGLNKGNLSSTAMPEKYGKYCMGYRAFRIDDWNNFTQKQINDILSASKTYRIAGKPKRKDVGNQQPSRLKTEGSTTIESMFDESQIEVSRVGHKLLMSEAVGTRKCDDIV